MESLPQSLKQDSGIVSTDEGMQVQFEPWPPGLVDAWGSEWGLARSIPVLTVSEKCIPRVQFLLTEALSILSKPILSHALQKPDKNPTQSDRT
jgi:hypothetical protein